MRSDNDIQAEIDAVVTGYKTSGVDFSVHHSLCDLVKTLLEIELDNRGLLQAIKQNTTPS